jgi:hypothetical protein
LAVTPVGAPGGVADEGVGVTAFDGDETGPDPPLLDACTVNV